MASPPKSWHSFRFLAFGALRHAKSVGVLPDPLRRLRRGAILATEVEGTRRGGRRITLVASASGPSSEMGSRDHARLLRFHGLLYAVVRLFAESWLPATLVLFAP